MHLATRTWDAAPMRRTLGLLLRLLLIFVALGFALQAGLAGLERYRRDLLSRRLLHEVAFAAYSTLPLADTDARTAARVRQLLAHGADPNARGAFDTTPLALAARYRLVRTARVLLEAGADPNARTVEGVTPLMIAAAEGHAAMVRLLLPYGADPAAQDERGRTAFDYLSRNPVETWEDPERVREILSHAAGRAPRSESLSAPSPPTPS